MDDKIINARKNKILGLKNLDISTFLKAYDKDAIIFVETGKSLKGLKAIKEDMQGFLNMVGPINFKLTQIDIWKNGNVIYEKGMFSYNNLKNNKVIYQGFYVYLWKEQKNGEYLMYREIEIETDKV